MPSWRDNAHPQRQAKSQPENRALIHFHRAGGRLTCNPLPITSILHSLTHSHTCFSVRCDQPCLLLPLSESLSLDTMIHFSLKKALYAEILEIKSFTLCSLPASNKKN